MSSNIWTPAEPSPDGALKDREAWRIVEAQHRVSTMKLVESIEEQVLLEEIIENTKPPIPEECRGLHYLLSTPFRYPPHQGSRFRRPGSVEGVFYAASDAQTAVAEAAFYRLLFFAESPGLPFPKNPAEYTAYCVRLSSSAVIDLQKPPYDAAAEIWMHPEDYAPCQAFAASARTKGAEIICYASVRDAAHRSCYAVLTCKAFAAKKPSKLQTWQLLASQAGVYAYCEAPKQGLTFALEQFLADSRLQVLRT